MKGFVNLKIRGEKHYQWKGNNVGYRALHGWVAREFGRPNLCEECKSSNLKPRQYQWANVSKNYLRIRSDWKRLCAKCHYQLDLDVHKNSWISKYPRNGVCPTCKNNFEKNINHTGTQIFCSRSCSSKSRKLKRKNDA